MSNDIFNHDIEKQRIEYVALIEKQMQHLQDEAAAFKNDAMLWKPIVAGEAVDGHMRITYVFAGKRITVNLPNSAVIFLKDDINELTNVVANTIIDSILRDVVKATVHDEVIRLSNSIVSLENVGKW